MYLRYCLDSKAGTDLNGLSNDCRNVFVSWTTDAVDTDGVHHYHANGESSCFYCDRGFDANRASLIRQGEYVDGILKGKTFSEYWFRRMVKENIRSDISGVGGVVSAGVDQIVEVSVDDGEVDAEKFSLALLLEEKRNWFAEMNEMKNHIYISIEYQSGTEWTLGQKFFKLRRDSVTWFGIN